MDEGTRSFKATTDAQVKESVAGIKLVDDSYYGWDLGAYVIGCLSHVNKFIQQIKAKGIEVSPGRRNISFIKDQKVYTMSWHNLYRFSGRAVVYKEKGENEMTPIELTYPIYLDMIIKPLIEKILL